MLEFFLVTRERKFPLSNKVRGNCRDYTSTILNFRIKI